MRDNVFPEKQNEKEVDLNKEGEIEKLEEKEKMAEAEKREELLKRKEFKEREERLVPTIEKIKSSVLEPSPLKQRDLTEKERNIINDLVSLVIKNPNIENGLEEANKLLNKEIRRIKKEGNDYAYLVDEFHDRLVEKIQEREIKFGR